MNTTTLSSKGQVIIPKEVRSSRGWQVGIKLVVEDLPAGILLRPLTAFPATDVHEGVGCAGYSGACKSVAQMKQGIERMMRRQWRRNDKS
jgi:AbrB family looped-hinge helix DNA binding protein